ncbi:MAG TPA: hypothetical protein VGM58_03995 [Verrucomicrobiae bacterium]|jgi:hypothetical protein
MSLNLQDENGNNILHLTPIKRIKTQGPDPGFFLEFGESEMSRPFPTWKTNFKIGKPMLVRDLKKLKRLEISAEFLPDNSEILKGIATVIVNTSVKTYTIPSQTAQSPFVFIFGQADTNEPQ